MLRRNRERFLIAREAPHGLNPEPINGWNCWGLGYLDEDEKTVGCLLHPSRNNGIDYRYLVVYEGKCAREMCLEAKTFEALSEKAKRFYLDLSLGMDSFEYSSREGNPIFRVLPWGRVLNEKIAEAEAFRTIPRDEFRERYKVFLTTLSYKTDGYCVEKLAETIDVACLKEPGFFEHYQGWQEELMERFRINDTSPRNDSGRNPLHCPVHLYDIPLSFSRLLKFALNIWRAPEERVISLKEHIDREIERFIESSRSLLV